MIKYGDLVQYIKDNHVNWNTDLFDVLRGFFESQSQQYSPQPPLPSSFSSQQVKTEPLQQKLLFQKSEFHQPENGEYTTEDLLNLFST
jgi:hypothetical protein